MRRHFSRFIYDEGVISAANETAKKMGVTIGMAAKEAADKMLEWVF